MNDNPTTTPLVNEQLIPLDQISHLNEIGRSLMLECREAQIRGIFEDKFVLHEQARKILVNFKEILSRPMCERPLSFALLGAAGTGKSAIVHRFFRDLGGDPARMAAASDRMPVLIVELPPRATEPRTILSMARALKMPVVNESEGRKFTDSILRKLVERRVRLVVFLEFDHIGPIGPQEREVVGHLIKNITNEGISVVAVGTKDSESYILEDDQVQSRLRPLYLNGLPNGQEFFDFLKTLEGFYPFSQPSYLWRDHASYIFKRSDGLVGEIVYLVNEAAAWALRNNRHLIDREAFDNCSYIEQIAVKEKTKR